MHWTNEFPRHSYPCELDVRLLAMEELLRYIIVGHVFLWSVMIAIVLATLYVGYLLFPIMITFVRRSCLWCKCISYFVCEFICWEVVTYLENWRRPIPTPFEDPWPSWEVVADLQESSNEELFRVILCDVEPPMDDSLYPHVSLIYAIGVQDRNRFWRDITVWRVSTLTGKRQRVHTFHTFLKTRPHLEQSRFRLSAHQSHGVIFVYVHDEKINDNHRRRWAFLFVYDTRFKKSASVVLPPSFRPYKLAVATVCLGRNVKADRSISGWRIRLLAVGQRLYLDNRVKSSLVNVVMDICASTSNVSVISEEDLLFRYLTPKVIRAAGTFAVHHLWHGQMERVFAYNSSLSRFETYNDLVSFKASYGQYSKNWSRDPVTRYPAVMTEWEDITMFWRPVFLRTNFKPPSLKLLAARALLKKNPELGSMSVVEFRRKTGLDLVGHLRAEERSSHSMLCYV